MKPAPVIVFSDLDGTLLDHHSYRFDAATAALDALRARDIPLILTTSKTLAEVADISRALGEPWPVIVENGCALCFPVGRTYPFELTTHERVGDYALIRFAPPYTLMREFITQQRSRHGWQLRGFGDMPADEVAQRTGLGIQAAAQAKQRMCSEPFVWEGSAPDLAQFINQVDSAQLHITRGGRFWHLMGNSGKAEAMHAMRDLYATNREQPLPAIALGDSENDRGMLQAADIAVVVRRHDGTHLDCHGIKRTLFTELAGPAGWNAAVLQLLKEMDLLEPTT